MRRTKILTYAALIVALDILVTRTFMSVMIGGVDRISLQFLPNAIAGALLGPAWGALTCIAGDLLGMALNSGGVSFSPLFTISAGVRGMLYGMLLYKRDKTPLNMLIAVAVVTLVVDLGLNPLFLSIYYGKAYLVILYAKIPVRIVATPIYAGLLYLFWRYAGKYLEKSAA